MAAYKKETYIHVRSTESTKEKLKELADVNSRSQAEQLEYLINRAYALEKHLKQEMINPNNITF